MASYSFPKPESTIGLINGNNESGHEVVNGYDIYGSNRQIVYKTNNNSGNNNGSNDKNIMQSAPPHKQNVLQSDDGIDSYELTEKFMNVEGFDKERCDGVFSFAQNVFGRVCTDGDNDKAKWTTGNEFARRFPFEKSKKQIIEEKRRYLNNPLIISDSPFYPEPMTYEMSKDKRYKTYPYFGNRTKNGKPTYRYPYNIAMSNKSPITLEGYVNGGDIIDDKLGFNFGSIIEFDAKHVAIVALLALAFIYKNK